MAVARAPLPYTNMNRDAPSAQHSAGKGLKGLLLSPHISGAINAGVPRVVLIRESGEGCTIKTTDDSKQPGLVQCTAGSRAMCWINSADP